MARKYKFGANGEEPVWPSHAKLEKMARADAGKDIALGRSKALRWGNPTYDAAYEKRWSELTQSRV